MVNSFATRLGPHVPLALAFALATTACAIVVEEKTVARPTPTAPSSSAPTPTAEPDFLPYGTFEDDPSIACDAAGAFAEQTPLDTWIGSYAPQGGALAPLDACTSDGLRARHVRVGGESVATRFVGINAFETSYRCYKKCVDAGVCKEPSIDPADPLRHRWDDARRAYLPVGYLTRQEAETYCSFFRPGSRLPTWAELTAMIRTSRDAYAHPDWVAQLLGCVPGAPAPTSGDRCARFAQHVPGPAYRAAQFPTNWAWDPLDQDEDGHSMQYGNLTGLNVFGGVAERTVTHLDPNAHCSLADGELDESSLGANLAATSHIVFAPLADVLRAADAGKPTMPEQVPDDLRSYTLGFRCTR